MRLIKEDCTTELFDLIGSGNTFPGIDRVRVINKTTIELIPFHKNKGLMIDLSKLDPDTLKSIIVNRGEKRYVVNFRSKRGESETSYYNGTLDKIRDRIWNKLNLFPSDYDWADKVEIIDSDTKEIAHAFNRDNRGWHVIWMEK